MKVRAQAYTFSEADIEEIVADLRTLLTTGRFLTLGDHVQSFEREFAAHHHADRAVAVSSGTAAIEIILRTIDVAGAEVVVPTNTFAATAFAVIAAGARPVFADVLPDLTVDPEDVARVLTPRTRAIITVHIGGLISPATIELAQLCAQRNVALVEDAAHAHGASLDGLYAGAFGIAAAFSFFSTKVMTCGEGGMIITREPRISDAAIVLRDQAKVGGRNYHEQIGSNWRLTELQAIVGRVQLKRLAEFTRRRRELAAIYDRELDGLRGLRPLKVPREVQHNFYKYVCFLQKSTPTAVAGALRARGVALAGNVYDVPLHEQPVFAAFKSGPLPVAEHLCRSHIALPLYPSLTDEEAVFVAAQLREILEGD